MVANKSSDRPSPKVFFGGPLRAIGNGIYWFWNGLRRILTALRVLPRNPRVPLWKYIWNHLPALVMFFILTLLMEKAGWFRGMETYSLDTLLRFRSDRAPPELFLITLDDQDYQDYFQSSSPLDPIGLSEILNDIVRGKPRVMAVDIDTSHLKFKELAIPNHPGIVWARVGEPIIEKGEDELESTFGPGALDRIHRGSALGGSLRELVRNGQGILETDPRSGLPLFLADYDGVVRGYRRIFFSPVGESDGTGEGHVDSFPWAVVKSYMKSHPDEAMGQSPVLKRLHEEIDAPIAELEEDVVLNFAGDRSRFRRMSVRQLKELAQKPFWDEKSPLRDKIVLLGGTYAEAKDVHLTPVGPRYGIELIAHAVETDLTNGGIRETNHWFAYGVDILVGVLLLVISWRFPGKSAFLIGLGSIFILALGGSLLAFGAYAYWFNFVPIMGGQLIELQWRRAREAGKLEHEVARLKQELAELKRDPKRGQTL